MLTAFRDKEVKTAKSDGSVVGAVLFCCCCCCFVGCSFCRCWLFWRLRLIEEQGPRLGFERRSTSVEERSKRKGKRSNISKRGIRFDPPHPGDGEEGGNGVKRLSNRRRALSEEREDLEKA